MTHLLWSVGCGPEGRGNAWSTCLRPCPNCQTLGRELSGVKSQRTPMWQEQAPQSSPCPGLLYQPHPPSSVIMSSWGLIDPQVLPLPGSQFQEAVNGSLECPILCKPTSLSPTPMLSVVSHTMGRASPMSQSPGVTQPATAGLPSLPHPSLGTLLKALTLAPPPSAS